MGALVTSLSALALAAGALWLWFKKLQQVALPTDRMAFVSAWIIAVVTGALALAQDPGFFSGLFAVTAILGSAGFLWLMVLAPQRADSAIQVGDTIPAFTAYDETGASFDSTQLHGKKLLIKFFRGHW